MKIGILTFHCAYNFGALLQAYALQETLALEGHDVDIIDYRPDYLATKKPPFSLRNILTRNPANIFKKIRRTLNRRDYFFKFRRFEKEYFKKRGIAEPSHYDAVIIGSDQIWNKEYNRRDEIWYGKLPPAITADRIITYAASAGDATDRQIDGERLNANLSGFSKILVRETCLKDRLRDSFGIESEKVIDPVLLAPSQVWEKWRMERPGRKYVLVYQPRQHDNILKTALKIADYIGDCDVVAVAWYPEKGTPGVKSVNVSPKGFVEYVKNAECVLTSSYHGTAVSIATETPFFTILLGDGKDARSADLLAELGLEDHGIPVKDIPKVGNCDFGRARGLLAKYREESFKELREALK